jgi:hypothetical protein
VASQPEDSDAWLECNGQSTAGYPELAAVVGPTVPNYQGMFLRGNGSQSFAQNNGSTVGVTTTTHSSGALGAIQGDTTRNIFGDILLQTRVSHTSGVSDVSPFTDGGNNDGGFHGAGEGPDILRFDSSRVVPTANENRPANIAVRYLIRARQ